MQYKEMQPKQAANPKLEGTKTHLGLYLRTLGESTQSSAYDVTVFTCLTLRKITSNISKINRRQEETVSLHQNRERTPSNNSIYIFYLVI